MAASLVGNIMEILNPLTGWACKVFRKLWLCGFNKLQNRSSMWNVLILWCVDLVFLSFCLLTVLPAGAKSCPRQWWPCQSVPAQPGSGPEQGFGSVTSGAGAPLRHLLGGNPRGLRVEFVGQTSADVFISYPLFFSYIWNHFYSG